MIVSNKGDCRIVIQTPEELFSDVLSVITAFIKYSESINVPEETIEKTLVQMIADGFNSNGNVKSFYESMEDEE